MEERTETFFTELGINALIVFLQEYVFHYLMFQVEVYVWFQASHECQKEAHELCEEIDPWVKIAIYDEKQECRLCEVDDSVDEMTLQYFDT